jgi:hypothetical protein
MGKFRFETKSTRVKGKTSFAVNFVAKLIPGLRRLSPGHPAAKRVIMDGRKLGRADAHNNNKP